MADSILDLTTQLARPVIRINGTKYQLLHPDELSIIDSTRYRETGATVSRLLAQDTLSDQDGEELSAALAALTDRIMVDVPASVRDALAEKQRLSIAEVFMAWPTRPGKGKPRPARARGSGGSK